MALGSPSPGARLMVQSSRIDPNNRPHTHTSRARAACGVLRSVHGRCGGATGAGCRRGDHTQKNGKMSCVRDGPPRLPARAADSAVSPPLHILTFATGAYLRWLEHLHTNLRLLALPAAALSVCAGDEPSLQAARGLDSSMGLSIWDCHVDVLSARRRQRLVGERFGTEAYLKIVHRKSTCILHQLRRLTSPSDILFFVDGDVTLFADPRPHFLSLGVDLALMSDVIEQGSNACVGGSTKHSLLGASNATANFNSGFFLLRNVPAAQGLWERMLEYHASHPATRQQPALNHLLQAHDEGTSPHSSPSTSWTVCSGQGPTRACTVSSLTFAALNEALFLNGFCFYIQRPLRQESSKIVAVHHNYVEGDDRKYKRAVAYETITNKADVDSTAFLRRARAAMGGLPAWESEVRWSPSTQRCNNTAAGERSPNFRKSFQSCHTNTKGKRSRNVASYVAPLCHHTPVALWSMPHSGANWLRMVLELSTGHSTASMFPNSALKRLMPSEEWPWEGPVPECGNMLVLSIRGHIRGPAWASIACGGVIARAVFLVRHPFAVAWSKFVSEFPAIANADAWSRDPSGHWHRPLADAQASGHWHRHAMYTARLWVYLTTWDSLRLDSAYRVWMKLGRPFLWVRVEDLTDDARGQFVLRGALDFLLDGNYDISQHVLSCALKEAGPLLHRLDDRVAPNQNLIEHAFENTSHRTGDGMWRQVGPPATKLGYTRYSLYTGKV